MFVWEVSWEEAKLVAPADACLVSMPFTSGEEVAAVVRGGHH
jgi:hypothetical protein